MSLLHVSVVYLRTVTLIIHCIFPSLLPVELFFFFFYFLNNFKKISMCPMLIIKNKNLHQFELLENYKLLDTSELFRYILKIRTTKCMNQIYTKIILSHCFTSTLRFESYCPSTYILRNIVLYYVATMSKQN